MPDTRVDPPAQVAIRCAACGLVVAAHHDRTQQAGAHEHTFVNPNGIVHTIGCYRAAPGVVPTGALEQAFTWFPGFACRVTVCRQCHVHLGWVFRCPPLQLHGLIVASLRCARTKQHPTHVVDRCGDVVRNRRCVRGTTKPEGAPGVDAPLCPTRPSRQNDAGYEHDDPRR